MILAVRSQSGAEELTDEDCEDEQEWIIEIERLSYLILWDYDLYQCLLPTRAFRGPLQAIVSEDQFLC